ncbi:MAG: hypothetical protein M1127_03260, partial [Patescibacteria group bacterium]|nr:hypothetical protein [Patescibacteria group bacterium]
MAYYYLPMNQESMGTGISPFLSRIKVERKKLNKQELKETVGVFKKKLEKENIPFEKVYVF